MTNEAQHPYFILPPGYILKKPRSQKKLEIKGVKSGSIQLFEHYEQPLPTLVQANQIKEPTGIAVKSLILVATTLEILNLNISQLFTISNYGQPMLQFFIHCSKEEMIRIKKNSITGNQYNAYQVAFETFSTETISRGITMEEIAVVQTFLWDIDPKTSRGTVTTVQPAVQPQPGA